MNNFNSIQTQLKAIFIFLVDSGFTQQQQQQQEKKKNQNDIFH